MGFTFRSCAVSLYIYLIRYNFVSQSNVYWRTFLKRHRGDKFVTFIYHRFPNVNIRLSNKHIKAVTPIHSYNILMTSPKIDMKHILGTNRRKRSFERDSFHCVFITVNSVKTVESSSRRGHVVWFVLWIVFRAARLFPFCVPAIANRHFLPCSRLSFLRFYHLSGKNILFVPLYCGCSGSNLQWIER